MSLIHSAAHGFVASERIYFGNIEPSNTGIDETLIYYVLAAGLTADDFAFSLTDGGAAVTLAFAITAGIVSKAPVYTAIVDPTDAQAPPVVLAKPTGLMLSSATTTNADGEDITRLDISLVQPTDALLRYTVVTVDCSVGNGVQVTIPLGRTTATIWGVLAGVLHSATAEAFDKFGNSSGETVATTHTTSTGSGASAGPDGDITVDAVGDAGTANTHARHLHGHKITSYALTPTDVGSAAGDPGTPGAPPARGDHIHHSDAADYTDDALVLAEDYTDSVFLTEVSRADAAYQPKDSDLTAIAALTTTAFGRALLALADAAAGRTALGLGTAATTAATDYQPIDADLTAIAALTTTAFGRGLLDDADAAAGRTSLGLGTAAVAASTDFQPIDSDLTAIAALTTTATGRSLLAAADAAALRTILALGTAATHATGDYQPIDATLTALAGVAAAADKLPYFNGDDLATVTSFTAAGRALIDDADAAAQRTTLGLGTAATSASGDFQPIDADLTAIAALVTTTIGRSLLAGADAAAIRVIVGEYSGTPGAPTTVGSAGTNAAGVSRGDHIHPGEEARGTMPGSPSTGDRVYRTDLKMEFVYDGTRWLSTTRYTSQSSTAEGITVTSGACRLITPPLNGCSDIWMERVELAFFVNAGTALSGSHKWVGIHAKQPSGTSLTTWTIDSGALSTWRKLTAVDINALLTASTQFEMDVAWTKTGTPGPLFAGYALTYRYVAT